MHEDSVHLCGVQGETPCIPAFQGLDGRIREWMIWDTMKGSFSQDLCTEVDSTNRTTLTIFFKNVFDSMCLNVFNVEVSN